MEQAFSGGRLDEALPYKPEDRGFHLRWCRVLLIASVSLSLVAYIGALLSTQCESGFYCTLFAKYY